MDGLVVSGPKILSKKTQQAIVRIINEAGWKINKKKTEMNHVRHGAHHFTGLSVNGNGKIVLSQKMVAKWRGTIHRLAYSNDPKSFARVNGFMDYTKMVYGGENNIPSRITKPYYHFLELHVLKNPD